MRTAIRGVLRSNTRSEFTYKQGIRRVSSLNVGLLPSTAVLLFTTFETWMINACTVCYYIFLNLAVEVAHQNDAYDVRIIVLKYGYNSDIYRHLLVLEFSSEQRTVSVRSGAPSRSRSPSPGRPVSRPKTIPTHEIVNSASDTDLKAHTPVPNLSSGGRGSNQNLSVHGESSLH